MIAQTRGACVSTPFRRKGVGVQRRGDARGAGRLPPRRASRAFAFAPPFVPKGEERRHG